jgi:predicted transposase
MKQIITAKLKLHADKAQFAALRQTQLAYRDALNYVSQYSFEHGKMSSGRALQRECYDEIRSRYHLPAQMACNVPRQVGASYKTLWTKVHQNLAARKAGFSKKCYKGLDQAPKYVSPTITYNYHRDYSLKGDHQVSLLTLQGRLILPYTGYHKHVTLIEHGAHIGAAKLWYDKPRKQFYLLITLELDVAEPTPETHHNVVLIGLEDLTHIRERTKRKHGKNASKKQRRANRHASKWAFAQLHSYIAYKALLSSSMALKIDAYCTSQACPRCGYTSPAHRPNKGLLFLCQNCHFALHADLVGARNITLRTLLIRQDWMSTGTLSVCPDVSCDEAKAERRRRYSELRWSTDTSSALERWGI